LKEEIFMQYRYWKLFFLREKAFKEAILQKIKQKYAITRRFFRAKGSNYNPLLFGDLVTRLF
jgi:hypothetical protein